MVDQTPSNDKRAQFAVSSHETWRGPEWSIKLQRAAAREFMGSGSCSAAGPCRMQQLDNLVRGFHLAEPTAETRFPSPWQRDYLKRVALERAAAAPGGSQQVMAETLASLPPRPTQVPAGEGSALAVEPPDVPTQERVPNDDHPPAILEQASTAAADETKRSTCLKAQGAEGLPAASPRVVRTPSKRPSRAEHNSSIAATSLQQPAQLAASNDAAAGGAGIGAPPSTDAPRRLPTPPDKGAVMRKPELRALLGWSNSKFSYIRKKESKYYDATFPAPLYFGKSTTPYWLRDEVAAWIDGQASKRGA